MAAAPINAVDFIVIKECAKVLQKNQFEVVPTETELFRQKRKEHLTTSEGFHTSRLEIFSLIKHDLVYSKLCRLSSRI
jgi:hypothetical protein